MTTLVALSLGLLIGLALGALGGGGSMLTVPALVYVLGEPVRAATTESLVIVGAAAMAGTVSHARARHVRWGPGLAFGLVGIAASYAGTAANARVDPNLLLLAFAALTIVVGLGMAVRRGPALNGHQAAEPLVPRRTGGVTEIVLAGLAVGFLTGFFGVGGGFVIVPALVLALGYRMPVAVGTSLLVIAVNSAVALSARVGHASFHWSVLVPFAAAALAGSLAGRRIADAVSVEALAKAFTALLFAVAGYVALRAGLALAA